MSLEIPVSTVIMIIIIVFIANIIFSYYLFNRCKSADNTQILKNQKLVETEGFNPTPTPTAKSIPITVGYLSKTLLESKPFNYSYYRAKISGSFPKNILKKNTFSSLFNLDNYPSNQGYMKINGSQNNNINTDNKGVFTIDKQAKYLVTLNYNKSMHLNDNSMVDLVLNANDTEYAAIDLQVLRQQSFSISLQTFVEGKEYLTPMIRYRDSDCNPSTIGINSAVSIFILRIG
jgi:hypothetical protein